MLAAAAREPRHLVIGIDADAASMADASRRAARPARKGGVANVLFVVAAAEALPSELDGLAARVSVTMPWGSLLRGCVGRDAAVATGIRRLLGPGARLDLLLAPADRDGLLDVPSDPATLVAATRESFEPLGLELVEAREAAVGELRATGSTWAKRLLAVVPARVPGPPSTVESRRPILVRFHSP